MIERGRQAGLVHRCCRCVPSVMSDRYDYGLFALGPRVHVLGIENTTLGRDYSHTNRNQSSICCLLNMSWKVHMRAHPIH